MKEFQPSARVVRLVAQKKFKRTRTKDTVLYLFCFVAQRLDTIEMSQPNPYYNTAPVTSQNEPEYEQVRDVPQTDPNYVGIISE